jgi:two-component system chemotaxis sensor kinase CheA
MPANAQSSFSISKLRNLILICLVLGVAAYTGVMFSLAQKLAARFGPQVQQDLEWRVSRGAQELARAAELGLAVADTQVVKDSFGVYAKSEDVQAIVAVGATDDVVAMHGKSPEKPATLFQGKPGQLRQGPGYLVSWANSEIEGMPIGKVAVVVSTKRLTDALALLGRSSNTALGGGLAGLFLGALVVTFFTRAVAQRDAQLSDYAANLERKVDERTRELDERNRGMRLVLDNVVQGFITVSIDGIMSPERSAIVDRWFGTPEPGVRFSKFMEPSAAKYGGWFDIGLSELRDDIMPAELVLDQIPKRFEAGERTFDVTYTPIHDSDNKIDRLLVIMSDVTETLARERAEREQKELVGLFQRISVDRTGVEEFLTEAGGLVGAIRSENDAVVQQRLVHTLKGNCAIYGLESYAELAHEIESHLVEHKDGLSAEQRSSLVSVWKEAMRRVGKLLGSSRRDVIEIDRNELDTVAARAQAGAPSSELVGAFADWSREPIERRLERLGRQVSSVARRLGKPEPKVEIVGNGVRLDPEGWSSYWAAMVHVVRNAVDHGLEDAETRSLAGKPEGGTVELSAERHEGQLTICVRDDGGGVRWDKVMQKAKGAGLPHHTHQDLVEALFADGLSTRDQASDVSGRGVGLAALRQVVGDLGGKIDVESTPGQGTLFKFSFEERSVVTLAARAPRAPMTSLVPNFS